MSGAILVASVRSLGGHRSRPTELRRHMPDTTRSYPYSIR
jgi:hypothetical protein